MDGMKDAEMMDEKKLWMKDDRFRDKSSWERQRVKEVEVKAKGRKEGSRSKDVSDKGKEGRRRC